MSTIESEFVLVFLSILPILAAAWTFIICRYRNQPQEQTLERLMEAHKAVQENSAKACDTTAMAARVLGETIARFGHAMDTLAEVAMTTHDGAAMERSQSKTLDLLRAMAMRNVPCGTSPNVGNVSENPQVFTDPAVAPPIVTDADRGVEKMSDM